MHIRKSLEQASKDVRLLWLSSFFRMMGYGLTNQVLTLYLSVVGASHTQIGLFMTLTLIGDTLLSYVLTWYADKIGRRRVMATGSFLIFVSGIVFATCSNFYVLLIAAVIGVISPSGDETGPFRSIEEASIAYLTPASHRPEIYAFLGMFSTCGAALGSLTGGLLVDTLNVRLGRNIKSSYRIIFWLYSGVGLIKFITISSLSAKCEIDDKFASNGQNHLVLEDGTHNILSDSDLNNSEVLPSSKTRILQSTQKVLIKLLIIFMLDSLGYGLMPTAWVVYFFKTFFRTSASFLGTLFFITNVFTTISSLPSAYLSKTFGPVKSIIFGQVPCAVFFIVIGFTINVSIASIFLILYSTLITFDVVPRQVLLTSLIEERDLTKVLGIVNIAKTLARCVGPIFTGKLADAGKLNYGFFLNGFCLLCADSVLFLSFGGLDSKILRDQNDYNVLE